MRADTEHLLAELFADAPTVRGRAFTRKAWLAENGIVWAVKDSERAIAHLRAGMQSLLSLKRTNEGKAPR